MDSETGLRRVEALCRRWLALADALLNRLAGWRFNPLYQSGTIAVAMLLVLLGTGTWLLFFYRVGAPWASVARITGDPWLGNWVRGLHRYASDAAVVATLLHLFRMFAQGRSWGPRTLAWVSGLVLLGLLWLTGWTGFVMVWDGFGQQLALEGARFLDALPILSEPIRRTFAGDRPIPDAFFFVNLFLHVAVPLGMGLGLWVHVSRLARPVLLPPRRLGWTIVALLTLVAVLWPLPLGPEASPFVLPAVLDADWFYAFWLPFTSRLEAGVAWAVGGGLSFLLLFMPLWTRRRGADRPAPSVVNQDICTGCRQCSLDCPWEAIAMVARTDGRADVVAQVSPDLCVSCGICSGSCAPMGVGPPGRNGRDQLAAIKAWMARPERISGEVVVVACDYGGASFADRLQATAAAVYRVQCAGNLHTSVIEYAIRTGAGGVLVLACPPRDCRNREGPRWLGERVYHDREAELQARVDRRRVALGYAGPADRKAALETVRRFQDQIVALESAEVEKEIVLNTECEPVPEESK
jgi:coenzyme F420-reducing hydrogenase delta subunit/Pyruvate/2-oxoacid:ferredoxin oxidoreductase delta subunit